MRDWFKRRRAVTILSETKAITHPPPAAHVMRWQLLMLEPAMNGTNRLLQTDCHRYSRGYFSKTDRLKADALAVA
jgi:hypothetical protein